MGSLNWTHPWRIMNLNKSCYKHDSHAHALKSSQSCFLSSPSLYTSCWWTDVMSSLRPAGLAAHWCFCAVCCSWGPATARPTSYAAWQMCTLFWRMSRRASRCRKTLRPTPQKLAAKRLLSERRYWTVWYRALQATVTVFWSFDCSLVH